MEHKRAKLAVTIWGDRVSPVFDVARRLLLVEMSDGRETGRQLDVFTNDVALHKARKLRGLAVDVLICGAISRPMDEIITSHGIEIIPFVTGEIADVLAAYLAGGLPTPALTMPGCPQRRRRCRRGVRVNI